MSAYGKRRVKGPKLILDNDIPYREASLVHSPRSLVRSREKYDVCNARRTNDVYRYKNRYSAIGVAKMGIGNEG
jgi:hypothetical protein